MGILVKDGGIWKDSEPYVRDAGIWKPVDTGFVKDGGVWKEFYSSMIVLEGSFETGLEGWSGSGVGGGTFERRNSAPAARTGTYSLRAWIGGMPTIPSVTVTYTVPNEFATPFARLTVYINSGGSGYLPVTRVLANQPSRAVFSWVFEEWHLVDEPHFDDWRLELY